MADKHRRDVERFVGYFKSQLAEIKSLTSKHGELYRKLLYVSVLDTLAGSVLPKRPNKERFVYFLMRFCRWPDGERVSLPHLLQLLKKNPDPAFEQLRKWALSQYKAHPALGGALAPISEDPTFKEMKKQWPVSAEHRTPIEGVDLVSLQHYHLLYVYRNMLVHELRTPGYGHDFKEDSTPYYHGSTSIDAGGKEVRRTVELVYPEAFLHSLCETGLEQLKQYFLANELNPYDSYLFGTYWIRELNA